MTTPPPKRRKLQFGLRKLLLWTALWALYLGCVRLLSPPMSLFIVLACWVIPVAVVRATFRAKTACLFSVLGGAFLLPSLDWMLASAMGELSFRHLKGPLFMVEDGLLVGCFSFAFVEGAFRAVNWDDDRLRTKTDDGKRQRWWYRCIRFRRLTVVEWLVILVIAGMLMALRLPPVISPVRLSEEDLELNDWAPGPEHSVVPDEDMRVEKVDIAGEWTYGYRTIFWIRPHKDDGYQVRFHSHSRSRACNLERTATYEQGVLVLNRPVKEMHGLAYQELYTVRIDEKDYLLPSARVMEFQDGRSVDWSRYDRHDLLEDCVLQRSPPGQLIDEDPFGTHE